MHRKKTELEQKEEEAKFLEQQFAMLEETTKDMSGLFEAYRTNVSFRHSSCHMHLALSHNQISILFTSKIIL